MPGSPSGGRSDIGKLVEKQMRNWEICRAQQLEPRQTAPTRQVEDFVTISRMVGSGGRKLAAQLGERLGWPVFDREVLQVMAGDDRVRARLYESLDERDLGWLEDTLRWLIEGEFRKEDYFHRLTETILALARRGHAVFLGRGADLMLPRDRGLRVCLVASEEYCAGQFARRTGVSETLARAELQRIHREREEFLRHYFGKRAQDPGRYDVSINMERLTHAEAIELICLALRRCGAIT